MLVPTPIHHPRVALAFLLALLVATARPVASFAPAFLSSARTSTRRTATPQQKFLRVPRSGAPLHFASSNQNEQDEEEEDEKPFNPYADPNYPELEFVNYADPEYQVDQGISDEFFSSDGVGSKDDTEEQVEAMREDRRRRNDEYQFQTYFQKVLRDGKSEYKGEWTVYKTSTFLDEIDDDSDSGLPRLVKAGSTPLTVVSRGYKETVDDDGGDGGDGDDSSGVTVFSVDAERIRHVEEIQQPTAMGDADIDAFLGNSNKNSNSNNNHSEQHAATEKEILGNSYWPESLRAIDFRGHQGIMVCGNAWTICTAVPLVAEVAAEEKHIGPFADYRAELGIQSDQLRFRIKLHYSVKDGEATTHPPLHLKSLTVCRETLDDWPRMPNAALTESLFGAPGAAGGLYDPPPVGSDEQASQYMLLDLEGGASVLFPYLLDQDPEAHNGEGWVTSLDWTPGNIRYQVDRKVNGGPNLLGLRTLELSEVQGADAEQWRPKDGGQNMRQ